MSAMSLSQTLYYFFYPKSIFYLYFLYYHTKNTLRCDNLEDTAWWHGVAGRGETERSKWALLGLHSALVVRVLASLPRSSLIEVCGPGLAWGLFIRQDKVLTDFVKGPAIPSQPGDLGQSAEDAFVEKAMSAFAPSGFLNQAHRGVVVDRLAAEAGVFDEFADAVLLGGDAGLVESVCQATS